MMDLKFSVYVLYNIWRWNAIAFKMNEVPLYFTFYLSFPSMIKKPDHMQTSFYRTTAQAERKILEGELREFRFVKREIVITLGGAGCTILGIFQQSYDSDS